MRPGWVALPAPLLALVLNAIAPPALAQLIQTVAGGVIGDSGPATAALVYSPQGVAADSAGNLYIADTRNNRVRKVRSATGVITTVAGTDSAGYNGDNVAAINASLSGPTGVAVDTSGNLYILDLGNNRIRKVTVSTGVITTVAGTGAVGYNGDNIAATGATLALAGASLTRDFNAGVAIDASGNLYIADKGNHRIRKVTASTGIITTVAGTGTDGYNGDNIAAIDATLNVPAGVTVDLVGNLYIADSFNSRVRKVTVATGVITTVAGNGTYEGNSGDNVAATSSTLIFPHAIAVDSSGNLYIVAGQFSARVRKVTGATGLITTVAGNGEGGYNGDGIAATSARMTDLKAVAVDSSGNLYIAEISNRIRKVTATTGVITTVAGTGGAASYNGDNIAGNSAALNTPINVAVDSIGNLYIAEFNNHRIRKVSVATGVITTVAGNGSYYYNGDNVAATSATLFSPRDVAVDLAGNLYIADWNNHRIRKVTAATGLITTVAGNGTNGYNGDNIVATSATLSYPAGIAIDSSGDLYIADSGNDRIRKLTTRTGVITTVAGNGSRGFNGDNGAATNATLYYPVDVAVDSFGNLYIADSLSFRIRKVMASTGVITTLAGTGTGTLVGAGSFGYNGDNIAATSATLYNANSVTVDSFGNIYIADSGNRRIRKVAVDTGIITTIAGTGSTDFNGDNIAATSAALDVPSGVAIDLSGNVYIADTGSNRVRKVSATASAAPVANYQGLWWNAPAGSESGWGINFAHQGDIIFATWFTYDNAGKALWLTMTAGKIGTSYRGTLFQTRGPAFSAVPFNSSSVIPTAVGGGELTFSDANNGLFSYTLAGVTQTKTITRQVFGPLPTCTFGAQPNLALATNYQDLWWAVGGTESGWGVNFTHQGDTIFATWFTYDFDGSPLWLSATAAKTGAGVYRGTLYRTTGPAFNAVPFLPANIGLTLVGALTLTFAHGNAATFAYTVNGITQSKSITRQVFNAPGTVCQ